MPPEYKLIVYPEVKKAQLFDLKNDPMEIRDIAGKAKSRDIKARLFRELVKKQNELGDFLVVNPDEY